MENENLVLKIDIDAINAVLSKGLIKPYYWKDSKGVMHGDVTLFCRKKKNAENEKFSHYLSLKNQNDWKDLTDSNGQRVYVGRGYESKINKKE